MDNYNDMVKYFQVVMKIREEVSNRKWGSWSLRTTECAAFSRRIFSVPELEIIIIACLFLFNTIQYNTNIFHKKSSQRCSFVYISDVKEQTLHQMSTADYRPKISSNWRSFSCVSSVKPFTSAGHGI